MKQHPIPQNILDVEFKLFSKFTIKEFIYIAVGIGFGSVFLFLYAGGNGKMPGIIAIPMFLICSGVGVVLGVVQINGQKADVYLKNFFIAITSPTQRVWKSKYIDTENTVLGSVSSTRGIMNRVQKPENKSKIIGTTEGGNKPGYVEQNLENELENEEKERLENIGSNLPASQRQVTQPVVTQRSVPIPTLTPSNTQTEQTQPVTITNPMKLIIADHNITNYKIQIPQLQQLPNNINLQLVDKNSQPVSKAVAIIRNTTGNIIQAKVADNNGLIISGKNFDNGEYTINIQHPNYTFPEIKVILKGDYLDPFRVNSL